MKGRGQHVNSQAGQAVAHREPQSYIVDHQFWGSAHLTTTLVHAISDVTGVDVSRTEEALCDHVDPMALDRIFRPKADGTTRGGSTLGFPIFGHHVTVYGTGRIEITQTYRTQSF